MDELTCDGLRGHEVRAKVVVEIGHAFTSKLEVLPLIVAYRDMCGTGRTVSGVQPISVTALKYLLR